MQSTWMRAGVVTANVVFALIGCGGSSSSSSSTSDSTACVPGETRVCVGVAGCQGGQVCSSSGAWGPCDCGSGTGGAGGTASTSTGSTSSTGSTACVPKTCTTLAVEATADAGVDAGAVPEACGALSDGCGNFLDCGMCEDPHELCGAGVPVKDIFQMPMQPRTKGAVPAVCNGGCTEQYTPNICGQPSVALACVGAVPPDPPFPGAICNEFSSLSAQEVRYWCCKT